MKTWTQYGIALAFAVGLTSRLGAQVPVAPGAAAVGPAAAAPAAGAAAGAGNIWSKFCLTPEQKLACKLCFCKSAIGKMITGMMRPVSVFSGGLLGNRCEEAKTAADLLKPPDSPEGAAARIKADEAAAAARRADVRYLGTVDCRYWPEAEEALIGALRADRNECVRWEAAIALGRGCCCTRKTIEALAITASGSERDGFPPERSERVRAAALASLHHCLAGLAEPIVEGPPPEAVPPPKEGSKEGGPGFLPDTSRQYYKRVQQQPLKKIVEGARRTLSQARPVSQTPAVAQQRPAGVFDLITRAFTPADGTGSQVQQAKHETVSPPRSQPQADRLVPQAAQPSQGVQPAAYAPNRPTPPAAGSTQPVQAPAPRPPAKSRPQPAAHQPAKLPPEAQHLLATLRYGALEGDRQRAAEGLAASPWATHADVTGALTTAGRDDASSVVRAVCLRCMSRINFNRMAD
ncbi:MAG: hypothetical protein IT429_10420 [Gemmataceae bacterium]|nr:hypothetical protein [Gemmataceae bacterium]